MSREVLSRRHAYVMSAVTFVFALAAQLVLVAFAGTDIPFHDQWNVEGQWLYPSWHEGQLSFANLLRAHNEHRIFWTHVLNLGLFVANGQWDPLVQLVAIAVLRASCVVLLLWQIGRHLLGRARAAVAVCLAIAFLPHLAWHSVLWGFESQVYFALGFSLLAFALLGGDELSAGRAIGGMAASVAALFAMGPAMLVPVSLLGLAVLRTIERGRLERIVARQTGIAVGLLLLALALRSDVAEHAVMRAQGMGQFLAVAARVLSWPHVNAPWAGFALNLPFLLVILGRVMQRRLAKPGENFVLLVGGWSMAVGLATAWMRGGSAELGAGVPSRYVDFIVLLPLANAWCAVVLVRESLVRWTPIARASAIAWAAFLVVGWLGLSAEVMRGLVLPRARDRNAPVRLVREFQTTGNPAVFEGEPRLLVPHPDLKAVHDVLHDPRMRGALPPSLQPEKLPGPLSHAVRLLLAHQ